VKDEGIKKISKSPAPTTMNEGENGIHILLFIKKQRETLGKGRDTNNLPAT